MAGWRRIKEGPEPSAVTLQQWGGLASFLLPLMFIVPQGIYLVGDLRTASGPATYALADFLFGPGCAACLVLFFTALRERIGAPASRQMALAVLTAALGAAMFVTAAFLRSANRQYLNQQPELAESLSTTLLPAWTTIVSGVIASGWHFLGWALVLTAWAGWASRRLPRGLSMLYLLVGAIALFAYLLPGMQGMAVLLLVVASSWQGIVLWTAAPAKVTPSETTVSHPGQP